MPRSLPILLALLWSLAIGDTAQAACRVEVTRSAPPVNACLGSDRLKIAAVGDVLLHRPLQARGYSAADGFRGIWRPAEPFFRAADIAYANLEGPVAPGITRGFNRVADPGPVFDNRVYSSYPMFNYHPRVIGDLKASGIDIVSTANNHSVDRGSIGIDLTIAALKAAGMPFMGTIASDTPRDFVTHTKTRMGRIAWIACTYSTNGIPDPKDQVLMCYGDRAEVLALIADQAGRADVAAVIVTPHWGYEYNQTENANQRALAAEMVAAGATAVIGTHPHVIQPWDWLAGPGGAKGLVVYSTGNFVSGQVSLARRTGALAWVELCRQPPGADLATALGAKLTVAQAGWVALMMTRTGSGPELVVTGPKSKGLAGSAHALAARLLPAKGAMPDLRCGTDADRPASGPVVLLQ